MHDSSERLQRDVSRSVFSDERLERAPAQCIPVWIGRAGRVEAGGAVALLDLRHLIRLDEEEFGARIDEASNEPGGCDSVYAGVAPGHPFHGVLRASRPLQLASCEIVRQL